MQNTPTPPRNGQLSVWGFTVGFAVAALFLGVIMWPAGMMMQGGWGPSPMMSPGTHPMMGYGAHGGWYIGGLLFVAIIAGAAGAIIASVHNALASKI